MKKRLLSILLTACMMLALLPTVALAVGTTVNLGNFSITYEGTPPTYESNTAIASYYSCSTLTLGNGTYLINGVTTLDRIVVAPGVTANVFLNGVNIDLSGMDVRYPSYSEYTCAFAISDGSTANLTLIGTNFLKSGGGVAGLNVPENATLLITASSTGSLEVISTRKALFHSGAAIGGNAWGGLCGTVTINGGTVTATSEEAPGIGGGNSFSEVPGGTVNINGGIVTVTGGGDSAGIGGTRSYSYDGTGGAGGTVNITGGIVTAISSGNGAGIGGGGSETGTGGAGGTVNISGGTVIAISSGYGAGIGGGGGSWGSASSGGAGGTVKITGGSVTALRGYTTTLIGAGTGHGVAGSPSGTLKNDSGENVTLYTLTLPGSHPTAVSALSSVADLDYTYSTTDMETDADGKLYVYLPAWRTAVSVTTSAGTYVGNISGNAATMALVYPVSGTVNAGTTGASVSGLTVNLYMSADAFFTSPIGSATTNASGAYAINLPSGSYVARVAGVSGSYAASVSGTITVSDSAVSNANITLSRLAYSGSAAPTPTLSSKTDIQVVLNPVTVSGQTVEYGKNTSNAAPGDWQDSTTFGGLTANTDYYFFARVKQAGAVEAGGVSSSLPVTTKTSAPAAPILTFDSVRANSVTITAVTGAEYSKDNGLTWQNENVFEGLAPATEYNFAIRIKELADTMPSATTSAAQYTSAATPVAGEGYTINYSNEKITISSGYEVSSNAGFDTTISSGATITPGTTYYVRVKAISGGAPASEFAIFTVASRPAAPEGAVYTYDYENEQIIFGSQYEVFTATYAGSSVISGSTAITPGGTLYIRLKATASAPASGWTTISIPARPANTGLSVTASRTDRRIIVTPIAGAEYSKNGGAMWQSSNEFAGLNPNTDYQINIRYAATASSFASADLGSVTIRTKESSAAAPSAPSVSAKAYNSITIGTINGCQYALAETSVAPATWDPAETANGTKTFTGLNPATQYYVWVRVAETDSSMPSQPAYVAQYTAAATPVAGEGYIVSYSDEQISIGGGYEVSTSAGFDTIIPSGATITAGTTYYVRVKAIVGGAPASAAISFAIPARPETPTVITADKTKGSITITPVAGQEYKIGSGTWGSGSFTGLTPNTGYTVYARVKATGTAFASAEYSVSITTKSVGSVTAPTLGAVTYGPANTLAAVSLPLGWAWSAPATVPTVTNSGYSAVYTPADTATVDYFGIEGYAVDGSGKVTVTRTVSLTVNRAVPTAADFSYTAPASLNYNGTAKTAAVNVKSGISGMGAVTVRYYLGETETLPRNAGTYTVKIDIAQGDNYAAAAGIADTAWTFTIAKVAQAPISITNKPAGIIIYGDTFTLSATGGSSSNSVTWAVTGGSSATVNPLTGEVIITGVGETSITATRAADGNYLADVTDTYTFTPARRLITVNAPSAAGGWTKTYDGGTAFNPAVITVGGITNKVGTDVVNVSVLSVAYDTADIGSGNKRLTITYAIDGANSENYSAPDNTLISTASITAATPTITLRSKVKTSIGKKIEIDPATVEGVPGGTIPDGAITYTYYTKNTCAEADKTSTDKSGADAIGGAPIASGTYYVKATIAASGNYAAATSAAVTLTIYYPAISEDNSSSPVIVDGNIVNIGSVEVRNGVTTVTFDQNKMREQLENAKDSVVIPITSNTDIFSAQLVLQNIESMSRRGVSLAIIAGDLSFSIPAGAIDTAAILKDLGAEDSSKVPLSIEISKLSNNSVTIQNGKLMLPPIAFTVTAVYNGKSVTVERFGCYVQRVIEIPGGTDPKSITTAVVVEADGTQRHVPTEVYSESGKWYAKINSMTNSTYALIQSSVTFSDTTGKWYEASVAEMASRKIIGGIGENKFAGDQSITRAEFAAILVRALGLPAEGTSTFSDVSASAWYSGAIATAARYGLVTGKEDNKFAPDAYITRQEAMIMLQRSAKLIGYTGTAGSLGGFTDASSVGNWAEDAAKWNVGSGLIVGSDGLLRPNDNISRAESATIILRLLQKSGLVDVRAKA